MWNPIAETAPIDKMFRGDNVPKNAIVVESNWRKNHFLSRDALDEIERVRIADPESFVHVYDGGYLTMSDANVYRRWRVAQFETPADAQFYHGADWGLTDPTVLVRCFIEGDTLFVDQEAYKVGCEIDETPALFAGNPRDGDKWGNRWQHPGIETARHWQIIADASHPQTIKYMQDRGFKIKAAVKGPGSVEDGIKFVRKFDIVIHPRCENTIREIGLYRYQKDRLTGEVTPKLAKGNDHCPDALRYAVENVRRKTVGQPIGMAPTLYGQSGQVLSSGENPSNSVGFLPSVFTG
jgi:phage terminase large subunit